MPSALHEPINKRLGEKMQKLDIAKKVVLAGSIAIAIGAMLLISVQAHAEYLGFPAGRSANISSAPASSVEAGFVTGDLDEASFQNLGVRFNFRSSNVLMLYLDVAQTEVEDSDGTGFGAGFFYQIDGITENNDFAVKVSYHTVELEEDGDEGDFNVIAVEGLFSGQNLGESDLRWYANLGIHKLEIDDINFDETEFGFGGGVFSNTSFGEFYGGIDLIDELTFGFGVRYHL